MNSIIAAETMIEHEKNRENTYIPNHKVSEKPNEYPVSFEVVSETYKYVLKPDNRCILDYGGKQVLVFDEVDRNTEQTSGTVKGKKTLEKTLRAYRALFAHSNFPSGRKALYQEILGTELPALVRFHFTSKGAMHNVMEILSTLSDDKGAKNFLFKHHEGRFDGRERYMAPMHDPATYREYLRVGRPSVDLSNPDTF